MVLPAGLACVLVALAAALGYADATPAVSMSGPANVLSGEAVTLTLRCEAGRAESSADHNPNGARTQLLQLWPDRVLALRRPGVH
jgi:hypothetical protein